MRNRETYYIQGPCGISWRVYPNDPGLQEGMILSDEPGYYEDGSFGIRIESLVRVVRAQTRHTMPSKSVFLTFEPVNLGLDASCFSLTLPSCSAKVAPASIIPNRLQR